MSSGKRYSKEEKEEIMHYRQNHTYRETADKYSVSQMTLARWSRKYKIEGITGDRYTGDPAYKTFLEVLKYLEGVRSVALFSDMTDGSSKASIIENGISEDGLFLGMLTYLSASSRTVEEFDLGTLDINLTKTSKGFLLIRGAGSNVLLIMVYRGNTDFQKLVNQDFPLIDRVCADISKHLEKSD